MTTTNRTQSLGARVRTGVGWLAALALASCAGGGADRLNGLMLDREGDGVLFLTQSVAPDAVMQALFQGRVMLDRAGCLRLDGPDQATVVWPFGYTLDADLRVRSDGGVVVGRIGNAFRLGGGEVPLLHDGLAVSETHRRRATAECPGRFWLVGDVLR